MSEDDVVIIGAGASGAAAAWRLAQAGLSVTCLERGGWVDYGDVPSKSADWELARQTTHHPNPNIRANGWDYPIDDREAAIKPLMYNAVGGSTLHWGAHFPRFRPSDFRVRTLDGVAGDWPFDYDALAPYYEENDRIMGVAGIHGDPGNPPREPRPMAPLPIGHGAERMARAFDELGWHWWVSDAAINTRPYGEGRGACNHCGPCDLGCAVKARSSTDITYWPRLSPLTAPPASAGAGGWCQIDHRSAGVRDRNRRAGPRDGRRLLRSRRTGETPPHLDRHPCGQWGRHGTADAAVALKSASGRARQ